MLPPGSYEVRAFADGEIWIDARFDFVLAADPATNVPALPPLGLCVLVVGVLGVARRRRR